MRNDRAIPKEPCQVAERPVCVQCSSLQQMSPKDGRHEETLPNEAAVEMQGECGMAWLETLE